MTKSELKQTLTTPGAKCKLQFPRALREEFERDCGFTDEEITTVYIAVCCNGTPTISAALGGVAGTINHVCSSMVKLA